MLKTLNMSWWGMDPAFSITGKMGGTVHDDVSILAANDEAGFVIGDVVARTDEGVELR